MSKIQHHWIADFGVVESLDGGNLKMAKWCLRIDLGNYVKVKRLRNRTVSFAPPRWPCFVLLAFHLSTQMVKAVASNTVVGDVYRNFHHLMNSLSIWRLLFKFHPSAPKVFSMPMSAQNQSRRIIVISATATSQPCTTSNVTCQHIPECIQKDPVIRQNEDTSAWCAVPRFRVLNDWRSTFVNICRWNA